MGEQRGVAIVKGQEFAVKRRGVDLGDDLPMPLADADVAGPPHGRAEGLPGADADLLDSRVLGVVYDEHGERFRPWRDGGAGVDRQ